MIMKTSTMAGSSSSPAVGSSARSLLGRKKKQRTGPASRPETKWRTGSQERIYRRRLLEALRSARSGEATEPRVVKEAADSALALTAKGQSRWSRAILAGRMRRRKPLLVKAGGKLRGRRRQKNPVGYPSQLAAASATTKGRRVKDRLRVLGRLVPGCRRLSTPNLLEEAADYVAALEMQVKAMRALADALSAASLAAPPAES